ALRGLRPSPLDDTAAAARIWPAPGRPRTSPVDRGAVPLTLNPAATPRSPRAVRFDIENWPIRDWLIKNWRKPVLYVFPEGLILLGALVYTHSHWLQNTLGAFADLYPYAVFGAGVLLGWRFHRLRLLPPGLVRWTPLADPALLAFLVALGLQLAGQLMSPTSTQRSYLWAIAALFLGVNGLRPGNPDPMTFYLATACLILIAAVVEASYHMAYEDSLTGLPARRALNEALLRLGGHYTLAMADVDHFKNINDRHGHDLRDQALKVVAENLALVGGSGRAFRYGGEEFAVLFPGKSVEEC